MLVMEDHDAAESNVLIQLTDCGSLGATHGDEVRAFAALVQECLAGLRCTDGAIQRARCEVFSYERSHFPGLPVRL